MAGHQAEMQKINDILGTISHDRVGNEVTLSYGAFIALLAELMQKTMSEYEAPTTAVLAVKLMEAFPPNLSHAVTPVTTEYTYTPDSAAKK